MADVDVTSLSRDELIGWLQRRADLLRPSSDVMDRALQRCRRHQARSGGEGSSAAVETFAMTGSGAATAAEDQVVSARLAKMAEEIAVQVDPPEPEAPIPSIVAHARTEAESLVAVDGEMPGPATAATSPAPPEPPSSAAVRAGFLEPGRDIEGYRIDGVLGSGGMGQVYQATQLSMSRSVAFKVLAPRLAGNEAFRSRFLREARNAGRLQHPNLIAVHDVGESEGMLFFSMEMVDGESVGEVLKREGQLVPMRALGITRQALEALSYAHARGLVHRDIKPDNLMLTSAGRVKVADLGLSRADHDGSDAAGTTQSGTMMGTPYYMPPEQGRDARSADARSDLYALGATLYHMVCGRVPFNGRTPMEVVLNANTQALTWPDMPVPGAVKTVVETMMARESADRYVDAAQAIVAVDAALAAAGASGVMPSVGEVTGPVRMRLRGGSAPSHGLRPLLLAAAILLGLLLTVLVVLLFHGRAKVWRETAYQVETAVAEHRYPAALGLLQEFQDSHAGTQRAGEAATWATGLRGDWDNWALDMTARGRDEFERHLERGDLERAADLLRTLSAGRDLMSPAVSEWVKQQEARLQTLRGGSPRSSTDRRSGVGLFENLRGTSAQYIDRLGPNEVRFRQTGRMMVPMRERPADGQTLSLTVTPTPGARWSLVVDGLREPVEVRVDEHGLAIWQHDQMRRQNRASERVWARDGELIGRTPLKQGAAHFGLRWEREGWVIQVPELDTSLRQVNRTPAAPGLVIWWRSSLPEGTLVSVK